MKCAIILERLLRFDLGTLHTLLGKLKFVLLDDALCNRAPRALKMQR